MTVWQVVRGYVSEAGGVGKNLRPYFTYKIEIKIPNMESSLIKSKNLDKEFSIVIRKE